jgi:thioredoxin reductase
MDNANTSYLDVAVIGGGPAGISACVEIAKSANLKVALFESEKDLGGVPRSCHLPFGLRDLKRLKTGPTYTRNLTGLLRRTSVEIHTDSTVLNIFPEDHGELHRIHVLSPRGFHSYECRFIVLATGCFESSRAARLIPGSRPAGVYSSGTLQQMVNLRHLKPGRRALIIGSEHVALSDVLTLKRAGTTVAGIVEEDPDIQCYQLPARAMSLAFGFPIYRNKSVKAILGADRVACVELAKEGDEKGFQIECDTVVVSGKFRPEASLIYDTRIEEDPCTMGPRVNGNLMTSVPNIFAAGNVLRGADMHDLCALEGRKASRSILKRLKTNGSQTDEWISLHSDPPIRYVVPQKIARTQFRRPSSPWFTPCYAIQTEHTLKRPTLEAWSGKERIWERSFAKLLANSRTPLPTEKFDWDRVDPQEGITLRIR